MFLLDTNVISETNKSRPHGGVLAWIATVRPDDLFLSAITIAEIQAGIERTRRQDPDKAHQLERWLGRLIESSVVLSIDAATARRWAKLMDGRSRDLAEDAWLAATALTHGLTVATRNRRDFEGLGVAMVNPFDHRD